jgi:hypothetical protein
MTRERRAGGEKVMICESRQDDCSLLKHVAKHMMYESPNVFVSLIKKVDFFPLPNDVCALSD